MSNVLYEAPSKFDFSILTIPIIMIIIILVFPWIMKKSYEGKDVKLNIIFVKIFVNLFCLCGIAFVTLWSAVVLIAQLNMYNKTVGAYGRGEYQIVEGYVENFDPMPYGGHADESFEINGVKFSYSDYSIHPGYNNTKSHGGVIKENGQHLKIGYVYLNETYGNIIVYIEQIPD